MAALAADHLAAGTSEDGPLRRRRFTEADVLRMIEAGIVGEDEHVELIEGDLIEVAPQGPIHASCAAKVRRLLERRLGEGHHGRDHAPIDGGDPTNRPESDVAMVRGEPDAFVNHHPAAADLVLVVEISVTSHRADREKVGVYARAGVPCFWHLDVPGRRLTVFEDPRDGRYREILVYAEDEAVPVGDGSVPVAALLPPGA